jgi:hypothetical protein
MGPTGAPESRQAFEAQVLPRIHLALRQFVRPIGPADQGSSSMTQEKPHVQAPEPKDDDSRRLIQNQDEHSNPQKDSSTSGDDLEVADPNSLITDRPAERDESAQKPRIPFWNPNDLLQLIKRIVSTEALNKAQKGRVEYQNAGRRSQKGLSLRKGTVLDRKAA